MVTELMVNGLAHLTNDGLSVWVMGPGRQLARQIEAGKSDHESANLSVMKIFISHSSRDKPIAEKLTKLIQAAFRLRSETIRCTSVSGHKLRIGADTEETLREEVLASQVVVGLITEVSMDSAWVLFELGARWGHRKSILPLVAAGQSPGVLEGPLGGTNALSCDDRKDVQQLIGDLSSYLESEPESPQSYEDEIVALLEASRLIANERQRAGMHDSEDTTATAKKPFEIRLSREASWLLMQASLDDNAAIMAIKPLSGLQIQTRKKQFVITGDTRSAAVWQSAVDELEDRNLVEDPTGKRELFRVQKPGFDTADELWAVFLLKEMERIQSSEYEFVRSETLAESTGLNLDDKGRLELQRYLGALSRRNFIEAIQGDGAIAGGRLTPDGRGHIKPFVHVDFSGLP